MAALLVNFAPRRRDHYRALPDAELAATITSTRLGQINDPGDAGTLFPMGSLAQRHRDLSEEIAALEERTPDRSIAANPAPARHQRGRPRLDRQSVTTAGDNPRRLRSSSSCATLCGTAPNPVSSGLTNRHPRGRDRHANAGPHPIVKNRMITDNRNPPLAIRTWPKG